MTVMEIVRMIGAEFVDVPDDEIERWLELISPMVSKAKFGKMYNMALAYLLCHRLKASGFGENIGGSLGKVGSAYGISSVSDGGTSISFNTSAANANDPDAEYAMTTYGLQFLNLRKLCIIPITIAGVDKYAGY